MAMYGVYRVLADGSHKYVSRTATANEKLAQEIAAGLTNGVVIMPDGSTKHITARQHVAKQIRYEWK